MNMKKLVALLLAVCMIAALAVGCNKKSNFITIDSTALGTFVQVKCKTTLPPEEIHSIIEEIDSQAKASMLSAINRNEQDGADEHIIYNIALAEKLSQISNGAYDITIKPLTDAWGFGREKGERRAREGKKDGEEGREKGRAFGALRKSKRR